MLCSNRPEGFGPYSHIDPSLPTTCFTDTIVVPLPTWIFLLAAGPILLLHFRQRSHKHDELSEKRAASRQRIRKVLQVIYYVLLVAFLAMVSLELARLSVAHLGVGLLPFTYVGIILAGTLHTISKRLTVRCASAVYWVLLLIAMAIKVAGLHEEENVYPVPMGVNTKYPLSDRITDNATMMGLDVVLAVLEIFA